MSTYYTGKRAQHYNTRWHTFIAKTFEETKAMIDVAALRFVPERLGRCPRVLDVACGTGILLRQLLALVPGIEAYGVDASADMLVQARMALKGQVHVHIERAQIGTGETRISHTRRRPLISSPVRMRCMSFQNQRAC